MPSKKKINFVDLFKLKMSKISKNSQANLPGPFSQAEPLKIHWGLDFKRTTDSKQVLLKYRQLYRN